MHRFANLSVARLSVVMILVSAPAFAGWKETVEFSRGTTGVRVTEPEGFRVALDGTEDTVPAVFRLAEVDAYVMVSVKAPSGDTWKKKIEVRRGFVTQVKLGWVAEAAPARPDAARRSHIGRVINTFPSCGANVGVMRQASIRADFVGSQGGVVASVQVDAAAPRQQPELAAGEYDVRAYLWNPQTRTWTFAKTVKARVDRDGWEVSVGCNPGGEPVLVK